MSTYACYDDAKEWGIEKKNILNKALSLNACYQNPVINLNERKNLVSKLYSLNYVFTPANVLQSFSFELLPVLQR